MSIKILVVGAHGRMGSNLVKVVSQNPNTQLAYALVLPESPVVGQALLEAPEIKYTGDLSACTDFDVAIDFSSPASTLATLEHCKKLGKAIVIGTTGFNAEQQKLIEQAATSIPVVKAANYSIGMNLMFKLVEKATAVMGSYSDIEILEAHHRNKVDCPSGTALALGRHIAGVLGVELEEKMNKERHGIIGPRPAGEIGFATLRASDVVGEHTVWFADIGERIEIAHKVSDRITFAKGALGAAIWLANKGVGYYDMTDVLDLNKLFA